MPSSLEIKFSDEKLLLDAAGAIFWPAVRALIVSDLHFEKASFLSRFGSVLPRYDTRATLSRIADLIVRYQPSQVICLGDSFHDTKAFARLDAADRTVLFGMIEQIPQWYWVLGNHDPFISLDLPGTQHTNLLLNDILFSHEPEITHYRQIIGHFHPKLSMRLQGHRVSGPAFLHDEQLLIMPAFGSFTGGLDVNDKAIISQMVNPTRYLIYRDRIWKL